MPPDLSYFLQFMEAAVSYLPGLQQSSFGAPLQFATFVAFDAVHCLVGRAGSGDL